MSALGKFVKEKRESLKREYPGYTIRALAERLGLHQSYLSKLERGEYAPLSQERIAALSRELGENEDLLMALGGKISDDLAKSIACNPHKFLTFLDDLQASPSSDHGGISPQKSELRRRELEEIARRLRQEVKKRALLEQNLRQKAHEKDVILSNLDGIFIEYIDKDYNLMWGTQNLQQFISTPLEESFGRKCYSILWNRSEPCDNCSVAQVVAEKSTICGEIISIQDKKMIIRSVPIFDSNGDVLWILRFGFDITDIHDRIEEVSLYEQRLREALDGAQEGIWEWKIKENSITYSLYMKRLLGYDDNILPESSDAWIARIHPDDRDQTWAMVQEHLRGETEYLACFFRMQRVDGGYTWILARGMVTDRDDCGNPLIAMGTHSEAEGIRNLPPGLSEKAEPDDRRLLENCPNTQLILQKIVGQQLGIGFMLFDCAQGILVEINGSALDILELSTVTEAMDRRCQCEILSLRPSDNHPIDLFQAERPARTRYEECVLTLRSGKVVAIGLYTIPVDLYGTPHVVKVLIDINRRRRLELHKGTLGHFEQLGAMATSLSLEIQRVLRRSEQYLSEVCKLPVSTNLVPDGALPTNLTDSARILPCELTPHQRFAIEAALSGLRESSSMLHHFHGAACFPGSNCGILEINETLRILLNVCITSINPGLEQTLRLSTEIPPLECIPEALNCALFCLLTNAVRHCASEFEIDRYDPSGNICVQTKLREDEIHISITSSRRKMLGIPKASALPVSENSWSEEGVHERLRLASDILQRQLGGSVFVKSSSGRELAYLVILPVCEAGSRREPQGES